MDFAEAVVDLECTEAAPERLCVGWCAAWYDAKVANDLVPLRELVLIGLLVGDFGVRSGIAIVESFYVCVVVGLLLVVALPETEMNQREWYIDNENRSQTCETSEAMLARWREYKASVNHNGAAGLWEHKGPKKSVLTCSWFDHQTPTKWTALTISQDLKNQTAGQKLRVENPMGIFWGGDTWW